MGCLPGTYWSDVTQNCISCGKIGCLECKLELSEVQCTKCKDGLEVAKRDCGCTGGKIFKDEASDECIDPPKNTILNVEKKYFEKKTQKISIEFDEPQSTTVIDSDAFEIELEESSTKNSTSASSTQQKMLTIFLKLSESVEDKTIYILPKEDPLVLKSKDKSKTFYNFPISLKINFFTTGVDAPIAAAGQGASVATNGMTAALMIISFNSALILIKIFQMLDFFVFLNLDLPLNVQKFMEFFDLELFNIVPNVF